MSRQGGLAALPSGQVPGSDEVARDIVNVAFQHHQAGRARDAETWYQRALALQPGHVDALYYLGVLYLQNDAYAEAEKLLLKALRKQPKFVEGHFNLGLARQKQDKLKEAAESFRQAIKADRGFIPAQLNLGNVYLDLGQTDRAETVIRKILKLQPGSAEAYLNLGQVCAARNDGGGALTAFEKALELDPNYAEAILNIGNIHLRKLDIATAKAAFMRALELKPGYADAHNNLGVTWKREGYLDEALLCFAKASEIDPYLDDAHTNMAEILNAFGDLDKAETEVRKAIELAPKSATAYATLGKILRSQLKFGESVEVLNKAIELSPKLCDPYREMGLTLAANKQNEDALRAYALALEHDPNDHIALNNTGMCNMLLGNAEEASYWFKKAVEVSGAGKDSYARALHPLNFSNKLFAMNYDAAVTREELAEAHFEYGKCYDANEMHREFENSPQTGRRLKIGYVSPDFRNHVTVYFIEEVLKAHDRDQFEIYCYAQVTEPDHVTERIKHLADHWRLTIERNNEMVASQIREDGIDILIDLAGHTAHNRLPVFGLKPAPVQVTWIGYPNTTGLRSIDYIFTIAGYVPAEAQVFFSEQVYHLPRVSATFKPPVDAPDVGPAPFERNGFVTFGCFNNIVKVSTASIDSWCEILKAAPTARLLLKSIAFASAKSVAKTKSDFETRGIDPDRVDCEGPSPREDYLKRYGDVDIVLDPFPYNGGTTTLEALYMGVPLLALEGDNMVSRIGSAILDLVGEKSLIAGSVEDFVAKGVGFAENPEKLAVLRRDMRKRLLATGITDPVALTRDVEAAYRDVWSRWCDTQTAR